MKYDLNGKMVHGINNNRQELFKRIRRSTRRAKKCVTIETIYWPLIRLVQTIHTRIWEKIAKLSS